MSVNVVLAIDVAADLILNHILCKPASPPIESIMPWKDKEAVTLWFPISCVIPLIQTIRKKLKENVAQRESKCRRDIDSLVRENLSSFFKIVQPLSSLGYDWSAIPDNCSSLTDALTSLAASEIPGETIIWTENPQFANVCPEIRFGNSDRVAEFIGQTSSCPGFMDLKAQQSSIRPAIERRIFTVLRHSQFILGPEITELEKQLSEYVGTKYAVTCSSGTDALLMVLMAYGVGAGDAVFTTPFTFVATAEVISLVGATPVFVDIHPETFNIDPTELEAAIEGVKSSGKFRAKGVIPVDLFGLPADYDTIREIAKKESFFVLEDAAQSFGALYKNRRAGSLGDAGATSFFPAKPLGCYGDGGAIFTDSDMLAERLLSIRVHGKGSHKYDNVRIGLNARFDTLQAGIVLEKLKIFPEELELRQSVAEKYSENLKGHVTTPLVPSGLRSAWAQYSILLNDENEREALRNSLKKRKIPTAIYYPKPLHLQEAFLTLGYKAGDFPVSENISSRILSLPMHPYLSGQQKYVIETVIDTLEKLRSTKENFCSKK